MMDFEEQRRVMKVFLICMAGLILAIGLTIGAIVALLIAHGAAEQIVNRDGKVDRLIVLPEQMR